MKNAMMELQDFHGWTEDKAWVVGDASGATVEFDNYPTMTFGSYREAEDYLWDRGYRY
jgi:hypothetical protein